MSERVLRQFGYLQTIQRHPHDYANPQTTAQQISQHYVHYLDHVLTTHDLGQLAPTGVEIDARYMRWFLAISHHTIHTFVGECSYPEAT
jgi:hypothetical protein